MNTPPTAPRELDRFETALLSELREQVAARPVFAAAAEPARRHRRGWAAGLASAAAAATAFVMLSPGGPAVSAAYAVTESADGDVVVTIHELDDADGLEAALQDHGIDADVSFEELTDGVRNLPGPDLGEVPPQVPNTAADCGAGSPATLSQDGDDWVLTIPADSPLQDRPVSIATGAGGALSVAFESLNDPWAYCAVLS